MLFLSYQDSKGLSDQDLNQGTLVIFNVDPDLTTQELSDLFSLYGEVKEIRNTPNKPHHRFVEFYDLRDAERAMKALKGCFLRVRICSSPSSCILVLVLVLLVLLTPLLLLVFLFSFLFFFFNRTSRSTFSSLVQEERTRVYLEMTVNPTLQDNNPLQ
jgi:RNA recognition motif-containing protein